MRFRRKLARSQRIPAVRRTVVVRCVVSIVCVMGLIGLAYLVGYKPNQSNSLFAALHATIAEPAVALVLWFLLVLILAWCVQRLRLEWLVWFPGPILVRELRVSPGAGDLNVAQLTVLFRERLMTAHLQSPTTVPGAAPAQDFLEMLGAQRVDSKNVFASLVGILRAALPAHAYEVSADLVRSADPAQGLTSFGYGVTLQVTRLPHEAIPLQTCWAPSWEDAVRRAADDVTTVVLPRTRQSRSGPWCGWRRYTMPQQLVHCYERGQERTTQRRYDEALASYYSALELDPKNVTIRLNIGFVQEKLGLFVDAVATYAGAQRVAALTDRSLYARRARRERRAVGLIADYRLAILLAGPKVAHQWRNDPPPDRATERDRQRALLRERLGPELVALLRERRLLDNDRAATDIKEKPPWTEAAILGVLEGRALTTKPDDELGYFRLRKVLVHLALRQLTAVRLGLTRPVANSIPTSPSMLTVGLTREWVKMRRRWIEGRLETELQGSLPPHLQAAQPGSRSPKKLIKRATLGARFKNEHKFGTWTDHYNAACVYALPLLVENASADTKKAKENAERAIEHLRLAVSCTSSGYVAERGPWLVSEDPDLNGLRLRPEFRRFEALYFPSATHTPYRPRKVHAWEMSCYVHLLLAETARGWHHVWHLRRDALCRGMNHHGVMEWFADEANAWRLVQRLAKHHRHWRARYELIEEVQRWRLKYEFPPIEVGVVPFAVYMRTHDVRPRGDMQQGSPQHAQQTMQNEFERNRDRLHLLHALMDVPSEPGPAQQPRRPLLAHPGQWQSDLRDRDALNRPLRDAHLANLCDAHAALWQRLYEWLEEDPITNGADAKFGGAMRRTTRLWSLANSRWIRATLAQSLA
jgi:TPR repeat